VPIAQAVHVVLTVLDALGYAHGLTRPNGSPLGVVHRDISPGNVLIDVQGHVKLADFGIARTADDEFKTQEGLFRGTLPYSPPEALDGGPVDARGDQYGCAVLLYQLLTGNNPFKGTEPANTITRILTYAPARPSSLRPEVPPGIDAAVMKALSRSFDDRFASAGEFAEALRRGATWSERDAARDFATQVAQDFTGELPERLGLESLALRDAAWREAQDSTDASRVALSTSPPDLRSSVTKRDGLPASIPTAPLPQGVTAEAAPERSRPWGWFALAGLGVAAAAASFAVVLSKSNGSAPAPIIVEKQSLVEAVPATGEASPNAVPAASAVAGTPAASGNAATATTSAPTKSESGSARRTLASAFQRRQGAIQRCFTQNPDALAETQRISVRFEIDRSGRVASAALSPASLQGQPLGGCILGVARSTDFGPQSEAVSFTIPISARMVAR
jgi:serine/threonine-protein kinase